MKEIEDFIKEVELCIELAEVELNSTSKDSHSWYLTKGKLNGYKFILSKLQNKINTIQK